jgi:heme/copper-type cytochrome/quinol oxidase subunit 4
MLTFLGLKVSYETLAFLALFLGSEVVGASKLKENSLVQVALSFVSFLKLTRKEDDQINKIKDVLK